MKPRIFSRTKKKNIRLVEATRTKKFYSTTHYKSGSPTWPSIGVFLCFSFRNVLRLRAFFPRYGSCDYKFTWNHYPVVGNISIIVSRLSCESRHHENRVFRSRERQRGERDETQRHVWPTRAEFSSGRATPFVRARAVAPLEHARASRLAFGRPMKLRRIGLRVRRPTRNSHAQHSGGNLPRGNSRDTNASRIHPDLSITFFF